MKSLKSLRSLLMVLSGLLPLQGLPVSGQEYTSIPGVFSTGVDGLGSPLTIGSTDAHWQITSSPGGAGPAIATDTYFMWIGNTSSSAWINGTGSSADNAPAGLYIYTTTFSLGGFDPSTASISGQWASDNVSEIYLNGVSTGISSPTSWEFAGFSSFTLDSGFVAGLNTLSFYVTQNVQDIGNPTGLQVNILSATAAVPEPGALVMLVLSAAVASCVRGSASRHAVRTSNSW
jgi:hypothetical protein